MSRPKRTSLFIADRCDRCSAQAFVAVQIAGMDLLCSAQSFVPVQIAGMELLFCGHHFNENELALASAGGIILVDARDSINEKPSVSANA